MAFCYIRNALPVEIVRSGAFKKQSKSKTDFSERSCVAFLFQKGEEPIEKGHEAESP